MSKGFPDAPRARFLQRQPRRRSASRASVGASTGRRRSNRLGTGLLLTFAALLVFQATRPLPPPTMQTLIPSRLTIPGAPLRLPWPSQGQAAMAVAGIGLVGHSGGSAPVPIASVTKVMTALVILHDHPLAAGASGPSLRMTSADVTRWRQEFAQGDSIVPVAAGEVLTERQLLEGLLIPSGDNFADMLAQWDAGSIQAFTVKMNAMAARLGLHHTHYADASGVNPGSVSTALDQLHLAEVAMRQHVFARIVAMPSVHLPVAGNEPNYNGLVGTDGVIGVKTGSTPEAGGCLSFAATRVVHGRPVVLYGVVLGQQGGPLVPIVLSASQRLLDATAASLRLTTVLPAGRSALRVATAWGNAPLTASLTSPLQMVGWTGLNVQVHVTPLGPSGQMTAGAPLRVGVRAQAGKEQVASQATATGPLRGPSLGWRLDRRLL